MSEPRSSKSNAQIGSLVITALFVIVGVITLYDTTSYTDRDSQVFPQTVAIVLIITAGLSLIIQFLRPDDEAGFGTGIWWRRILMIVTMFLTCFAIPITGFLIAGTIAFTGGLITAMHDKWAAKTALLYFSSGAVILIAFFSLFKFILHVPLP